MLITMKNRVDGTNFNDILFLDAYVVYVLFSRVFYDVHFNPDIFYYNIS